MGNGLDVLLVSVDTLRADHLSLYGYHRPTSPRFDEFFSESEIHERAYSASASTGPSVLSMLSGLYPARHGVRLLFQRISSGVHILPDYLRAAGYQTAAIVSNMALTAEASGLSTRFDFYDDFVDERELNRRIYERSAARTTDAALRWLAEHRDPDRPHLLWVHYMDPHGPYAAPETVRDFVHETPMAFDIDRMPRAYRFPGVVDGHEYIDRYDEEIAYTDREVGRLLDRYRDFGLLDRAIVVFTADHGEAMIEHSQYFHHTYHVWEELMHVPLAVLRPGGTARRVATPVSLVDLLPTLLADLDLEVPAALDGRHLDDRRPGQPVSLESLGTPDFQHRAAIVGDRKWYATVDPDGSILKRWHVDLASNSAEMGRAPWPGEREGGAAALLSWIRQDPDPAGRPIELLRGEKIASPKVAPGRTEDELKALRALGYVE